MTMSETDRRISEAYLDGQNFALRQAAEAFASRGSSLGTVDRLKAMAELGADAPEHALVDAYEARLKREGRA